MREANMLTRKAKRLLSLTAATPLLFAACTDNSLTNPFNDAAGNYLLTVYAGRTVPATYTILPGDPAYPQYPNGATFVVSDGSMVLNGNGTFIETNNYVFTPTGESAQLAAFVSSGTWTLNGEQFSFSAPAQNNNSARSITGSLSTDANGFLTINYQESDGAGGFDSFEYKIDS
jgi:hypothetical protein